MTTACIIAAVCILVAGLFAVIVERTTERDDAREAAERAGRERDAAEKALADERATVRPVRLMSPEQIRRENELALRAEQMAARPLRVVPTQREPEHDHLAADDDWFARLYDDKGNLR